MLSRVERLKPELLWNGSGRHLTGDLPLYPFRGRNCPLVRFGRVEKEVKKSLAILLRKGKYLLFADESGGGFVRT